MNDKLAKYLRKTAKQVGQNQQLPDRLLVTKKVPEDPKEAAMMTFRGTIFNHPQSVRGFYRHLKKFARLYHGNHARRTQVTPSG